MDSSRTDGHHDRNADPATVMALNYRCRSCGVPFAGSDLHIWDAQLEGGTPGQRLADSGLTVCDEDRLRCPNCEGTDIYVTNGD
jgi:hypothetical protein